MTGFGKNEQITDNSSTKGMHLLPFSARALRSVVNHKHYRKAVVLTSQTSQITAQLVTIKNVLPDN